MTYLLRIDSSSREKDSHSKRLADLVQESITRSDKDINVMHRDLSTSPIEHIQESTIEGFYTDPNALTTKNKEALSLSNKLIKELKGADTLIISAPIYNFGVPSALKAWIDQIVRINVTFSYDGNTFGGLVLAKSAVLCLSYGAQGYKPGGEIESMNYLEPYLKSLMAFLGIKNTIVFSIEGTTSDEDFINEQYEKFIQEINKLNTNILTKGKTND